MCLCVHICTCVQVLACAHVCEVCLCVCEVCICVHVHVCVCVWQVCSYRLWPYYQVLLTTLLKRPPHYFNKSKLIWILLLIHHLVSKTAATHHKTKAKCYLIKWRLHDKLVAKVPKFKKKEFCKKMYYFVLFFDCVNGSYSQWYFTSSYNYSCGFPGNEHAPDKWLQYRKLEAQWSIYTMLPCITALLKYQGHPSCPIDSYLRPPNHSNLIGCLIIYIFCKSLVRSQ